MSKYSKVVLLAGLVVLLLACTAAVAGARVTYTTTRPALSNTPTKDRAFTASGVIRPKSTSSNRAIVRIILWMKYDDGWGVMDTYRATLSKRPPGQTGTRYACTITIPMKGPHGVQAVQYRAGKVVSRSSTRYFTVQP